MRLLIAEDDRALGTFLSRGLEAEGHRVRVTTDGASAVNAFREDLPDLTILDLNLPVKDGEQVLDEVRRVDADLPILVLTARQEVETRVRCLDRGADDLMTKPFSLHELRARCRALLRRKREAKLLVRAGDLEVDRMNHSAVRAGEEIALTNKEFALLEHLMLNRGQCVSRVELAGNGVEAGAGADDQHRGCLRELPSPQAEGSCSGPSDPHGKGEGLHDSGRSGAGTGASIRR